MTKRAWTELTNLNTTVAVEAFKLESQVIYVNASRPTGGEKKNYPLRIDIENLDFIQNHCNGSTNSVINAMLKYAKEQLIKNNETIKD